MTRDDWRRVEPTLTRALLLSEGDRDALVDTLFLEDAVRRRVKEVLRQSSTRTPSVAVAGGPATPGPADATPPGEISSSPPVPVLSPGDALEGRRFLVVRQIGRGGMADVYLAQDTTLGTLVGLKVLPSDEQLIREAQRAAICSDHPNVVTVHNVLRTSFNDQAIGVLVMDYVAGTPASKLLDDGPVALTRALGWIREVAAAVAHAHDRNVLHCDLKPANILITPDDHAMVLDFGIARATFDASNEAEPLRGTMPYMAPEQLLAREFSPAGDIYSLGVTLFELITGRRPFDGDDVMLRLQIVATDPPKLSELAPGVPAELEAIVQRALAKDPDDRFKSARAFARALNALEPGPEPVPVPRPSILRRLTTAAAWIVGLVLAFMALGAFTSRAFNMQLGRSDFITETPLDWLVWGRRASMGPLVMLVMVILPLAIVRLFWRVLTTLSSSIRAVDQRSRRVLQDQVSRLHLDDATVMSACALIVSLGALTTGIYLFRDLFPAFVALASDGSSEDLALLSPDFVTRHNRFRNVFTGVVILTLAVWYPLVKRARRGEMGHWPSLATGALVLAVALAILHWPHRTMFYEYAGHGFEAARWQGYYCYILGQRTDDVLLLCPELDPPRHRTIRAGDSELTRLGIKESAYRRFRIAALSRTAQND